jgi:CheY-like chemotaxis protein
MNVSINVLIVEDDKELSDSYEFMCQIAASLVNEDAKVSLDLNVLKAFSYLEAIATLDEKEGIDLISIDLALQTDEKNLNDNDRGEGRDPGGMRILRYLQAKMNKRPVVVIMSGETLRSYLIDALQTYGIFAFFQKSKDEDNYEVAIQAIMLYVAANELISEIESDARNYSRLKQAEHYWESAKKKSEEASVASHNFPLDLDAKIKNVRSKLIDQDVLIPGKPWVEDILREDILGKDNWTLVKFQINNYSAFASKQPAQVNVLFTHLYNVIIDKYNEVQFTQEMFVGIWRQDYLTGPCMLAVFNENIPLSANNLAKAVIVDFEENASNFTGFDDNGEKTPTPKIAYNTWNGTNHKSEFSDWHQIINILGKSV